MKVLSIGTDRKLFEENSAVRQRVVGYGGFFDEMHVVVFTARLMNYGPKVRLSENTFAYATNSRNKLFYILDAFKVSRAIIRNSKFKAGDVVTCQDPFETGLVGTMLKLFFGLSLHVQIHTDLMHKYFWQSSFLNKMRVLVAEFVIRYSNRVRTVSDRIGKSIQKLSNSIDILPIKASVSGSDLSEADRPFPFTLLMVCRLEREKNIDTVFKAIKGIGDKDIGLCIVGDGSERKHLENMAKNLGISDKVLFVGWKDDLAPYYKMADAFVSASTYEGYGISIVEAAFWGKPLVLSQTGVVGEVFKEGDSAFICDALDADCFSKSILRIYRDKHLAKHMGESAKNAAENHLNSVGNHIEKYALSIQKASENFKESRFISRSLKFMKTFFDSVIAVRYFICGITAASVNIGLLYIFTDIVGIWYLYSSVFAFLIALIVSFVLQKFVVFKDNHTHRMHWEFFKFFIAAVMGVATNTVVMFVCVDMIGIWYILSQLIAGFFVMVQNFIAYNFFIFSKQI